MNPERSSLTPEEITIVEGTAKGNSNAEHAIIERKK
jgi:hypothetical protein